MEKDREKKGKPRKIEKSETPAFFVNCKPIEKSFHRQMIRAYGDQEANRIFYRADKYADNPHSWIYKGIAIEKRTGRESYIHTRHPDEYDNKPKVQNWIARTIDGEEIKKRPNVRKQKSEPTQMKGVLRAILNNA